MHSNFVDPMYFWYIKVLSIYKSKEICGSHLEYNKKLLGEVVLSCDKNVKIVSLSSYFVYKIEIT
jgi:hypothetical protein